MIDEQTTDVTEATSYTKTEQAHYKAIRKKGREVGKLVIVAANAKQKSSAAKKAFEAADEKLRELIRSGPDPQQWLPGMEDDKSSEEWRDLPLSDLGIDGTFVGLLQKADIAKIGELAAYMAEHGEQWWRNLVGIGEKKAEMLADLLVKFWAAHPEYCESPPDEVAEPSNDYIRVKLACDIVNENDDKLAVAGGTLFALVDTHGKPYLIDSADGERVYLEPDDYEVVK